MVQLHSWRTDINVSPVVPFSLTRIIEIANIGALATLETIRLELLFGREKPRRCCSVTSEPIKSEKTKKKK